jgi:alkylation response protein AidB-like acyl-CoA dehydrogenase
MNWYEIDPNFRMNIERRLSTEEARWCESHLRAMGRLCGEAIAERAEIIDKNPPRLERYDRWGEEINQIVHHPAAIETKRDLWNIGLNGLPWSEEARRHGPGAASLLTTGFHYLLAQADTGMLCAMAMTTGVANILARYAEPAVRDAFLPHLTTQTFEEGWLGAMFMTEKEGGSDIGATTTRAARDERGWHLNGSKWFCSNVDADAILTLARPEGAPRGVHGLELFLVPKFRRDGRPNGIHIRRLKDKLGTRTVPTAEVDFVEAEAYLIVSPEGGKPDGRGLNRMMEMVTGSRLGVAAMGLGIMRRCFLESAIYAAHRRAFGQLIQDHPMVRETLVHMVVELEAAAAMLFECGYLMGKTQDASHADSEQRLLRILVPLTKMRATRRGMEVASAAVEVHGGNGYIENWPTARLLREAQCHTIWEGTENIICLDVLRAIRRDQALEPLIERAQRAVQRASRHTALADSAAALEAATKELHQILDRVAGLEQDLILLQARRLSGYLADVVQAALLLEEATWEIETRQSARKAFVARLFAAIHLQPPARRGIGSKDRLVIDYFEPLTRYGVIPDLKDV